MDGVLKKKNALCNMFVRIFHTWKIADIHWHIYMKNKKPTNRFRSIFEQNQIARLKAKVKYILETC